MSSDTATLVTVNAKWSLADFFSKDNKTISLDIFKLISDKSLAIGASLGVLGYFYFVDRNINQVINHSLIPVSGIMACDYLGIGNIPADIIGTVGGSIVANKFYLSDIQSIENKDLAYIAGASILGGYAFNFLYNSFIYGKKADDTTITTL
jgi:hypothetical protein